MCCIDILYLLPISLRSTTTLEKIGREWGACSQHNPTILARSFVHGWLIGIPGRRFSVGGERFEVNGRWELDESERTQNKTPDSLVIEQWPRRSAIVEDLDATNCECIDIHRRAELNITSFHQLWCLPSEGSI